MGSMIQRSLVPPCPRPSASPKCFAADGMHDAAAFGTAVATLLLLSASTRHGLLVRVGPWCNYV